MWSILALLNFEWFVENFKGSSFVKKNQFWWQGEEEAMFLEYRKELRVIFNNVGALVSWVIEDC